MAWTDPDTKSDGDLIDDTIWNNQVIANLSHLLQGVEPNGLSNSSGGTLSLGDVVIMDTGADLSFTTTTASRSPLVIGVLAGSVISGCTQRIAVSGAQTVKVDGPVTRGYYIESSSTAGRAQAGGTVKTVGSFGLALETHGAGVGTISAMILNSFVGGGVPTDSMHYYTATASAPTGYTEYTAASGRVIVGLSAASVLGNSIGTALTDDENREVGEHTHGLEDPGHAHVSIIRVAPAAGTNTTSTTDVFVDGNVATATTGITVDTSGSVAGTPAPYLSLTSILRS